MKFIRFITLPIACLATVAMLSGCGDSASITGPEPTLDTTAPPAPSELRLTTDGSGNTVLAWTESAAPDVAGYQVYVYSAGLGFVEASDADNTDSQFQLPDAPEGSVATYRVRAVDTSGNRSSFSSAVDVNSSALAPLEIPE